MKKLFVFTLSMALLILNSCDDQLREGQLTLAEDVSYATDIHYLLSGSLTSTGRFLSDRNSTREDMCPFAIQHSQFLHDGESGNTYGRWIVPPSDWDTEYGTLLQNVESGLLLAKEQDRPAFGAIFEILRVVIYSYLTNTYGDIPYSEAMKGREGIFFPKFDPQKEIYEDFFVKLDQAIQTLASTSDAVGKTEYDMMFRGDKDKWIRFANSLKLRLYVYSYEAFKKSGVDHASQMQALATGGKLMETDAHCATILFDGSVGDNSYIHGLMRDPSTRDREFRKRKPACTFIDVLKNTNDPRLGYWIAPAYMPLVADADFPPSGNVTIQDSYGYSYLISPEKASNFTPEVVEDYPLGIRAYVGAPIGGYITLAVNKWGYNPVDGNFNNRRMSDFGDVLRSNANEWLRCIFMNADEVQFLLAECRQRGWITAGDVETYYKKGIVLSGERWGIKSDEITAFLNEPSIQLGSDQLNQIATQKWLAFFNFSTEYYFDYRRTRLPRIIQEYADAAISIVLPFPIRKMYPSKEAANNKEEYKVAVERLVSTQSQTGLNKDSPNSKMWLMDY